MSSVLCASLKDKDTSELLLVDVETSFLNLDSLWIILIINSADFSSNDYEFVPKNKERFSDLISKLSCIKKLPKLPKSSFKVLGFGVESAISF